VEAAESPKSAFRRLCAQGASHSQQQHMQQQQKYGDESKEEGRESWNATLLRCNCHGLQQATLAGYHKVCVHIHIGVVQCVAACIAVCVAADDSGRLSQGVSAFCFECPVCARVSGVLCGMSVRCARVSWA